MVITDISNLYKAIYDTDPPEIPKTKIQPTAISAISEVQNTYAYFATVKNKEDEVKQYLKDNLFPYMIKNQMVQGVVTDVSSVIDINGADILLFNAKGDIKYTDIKSQFAYLNNPTNTWSFELTYFDKIGNRVDGWWLQCQDGHPSGHNTDYFALVYMDNTGTDDVSDFRADKIKQLSVLFIKKDDLAEYLKRGGKTPEILKKEAEEARTAFLNKKEEYEKSNILDKKERINEARRVKNNFSDYFIDERGKNNAYYYVSDGKKNMISCPVNLIIKRNVLESFSHSMEFVVKPGEVIDKTAEVHNRVQMKGISSLKNNNKNMSFSTTHGIKEERNK